MSVSLKIKYYIPNINMVPVLYILCLFTHQALLTSSILFFFYLSNSQNTKFN